MLIIGITGTLGAGKGTIVDYLVNNKGFKHYSVSRYLKEELAKRNLVPNRTNLQDMGNEIREKFGPDSIVKRLFKKAKNGPGNAVIESIRNPKEAEFIKSRGGYLIAVEANQKTRYERIKLRKTEKDIVTFTEFSAQEARELQSSDPTVQNLQVCIVMANYKIDNDSSFEELYKKIEEVIDKIERKSQS